MNASRSRARPEALEIDGTVAPVTVLRLKTDNVAHIEKELRARIKSVRQTFPYAPIVVDVAGLDEASALDLPLHDLAERLRACKLLPVGVANLPPSAMWNAAAAGMAVGPLGATPSPLEGGAPVVGAGPAAPEGPAAWVRPAPPARE